MLETAIIATVFAAVTSTAVHFLWYWGYSIRLRRLEVQLAEWEERLVREVKQRAAAASAVARHQKLNPIDEALVRQHTGVDMSADEPWWARFTPTTKHE